MLQKHIYPHPPVFVSSLPLRAGSLFSPDFIIYSKTCLKRSLKKDKTKVLKTTGS